ncbi:hypothetical protein DFH05DRAFT_1545105 [Lentinula detonsa]|uniref:Protein kinase domain-containing protein n=1 Tax=Lentinula detonsa TaxID=2804962 RepID=A0A9W8NWS7_9AGAR|nr:hypothetical protein DFH05DRAFT_1545105 [Lentinula detonsa]
MSNPGVTDSTDFLALFSSVTLYGLLTSLDDDDDDSKERSITLIREQSFPAKRYTSDLEGHTPVGEQQWDAIPPPVDGLHADLKITDSQLGEGRMGQVFAAHLVSLRKSIRGETLPDGCIPLPSQFCIKLAKPEYIRSLAREAWFYEQLSKKDSGFPAGVITPICFGFFACRLPDNVQIRSWLSIEIELDELSDVSPEGGEPVYDLLDDDEEGWYCYFDDGRRSHLDSPWHLKQWMARADRSPFVGILITERLGTQLPPKFSIPSEDLVRGLPKEIRTELLAVLEDLNTVGILHGDMKFNNVMSRASESQWLSLSSEVCPQHGRVHPWRLIDFDRSYKFNPSNPIDKWYVTGIQNSVLDDWYLRGPS